MTDTSDKDFTATTSTYDSPGEEIFVRRPGFIKALYYHPLTQVIMLAVICFMCPGLFNALNGLGGAGQFNTKTSANANAALYATFTLGAFFAGSINNKLGSRSTLFLGSLGYGLYIGSFLAFNKHRNAAPFVISSGVILGFCAAMLWTAQGSLMLSYPTESQKGKFIAVFWLIFNMGAVVGASVSLGQNFHSTANSVGNVTYIIFLILTLTAVPIPLLMVDPTKMIRTDGSFVTVPRHPSWKVEFYGLWVTLKTDPMILLLFPMFFASNWFYTWQFNEYNDAVFNIRARSLNNVVYWIAQIMGSIIIGFILDQRCISRRVRAFTGWSILVVMVFTVHIWAYLTQIDYTRQSALNVPDAEKVDIFSPGYGIKIVFYIFCGFLDSMWQTGVYWLIGAMSNDPAKLAHFIGFYKSIQSAGGAGVWRADGAGTPYFNVFLSTWALLAAGLVFAFPMIYLRVKDSTEYQDEVLARMDDHGHIIAEPSRRY
ncbi:major facilitator superfamily domain-containing protein [Amanita rubescens]|nr:major facilitator superfamily domain-containing protein [Amanita rubescens]